MDIFGKVLASLLAVSMSFVVAPFVALILLFPVALVTGYVPQVFDYQFWVGFCAACCLWVVWFTDFVEI
mgnify:CR=1 FL=1